MCFLHAGDWVHLARHKKKGGPGLEVDHPQASTVYSLQQLCTPVLSRSRTMFMKHCNDRRCFAREQSVLSFPCG